MSDSLQRYRRQMLLEDIGVQEQQKLAASTALIVGCGALGTVIADLLARAGVGHLVIIDRDFVELSNLQRQTLFDEKDAAEHTPKAEAARRRLQSINSQSRVTAIVDDLNHTNIEATVLDPDGSRKQCDVIVDGVDNFETRFLINDAAVNWTIPYIYGGAVGTVGMCMSILPPGHDGQAPWEQPTACLRCLCASTPQPGTEPTCDTVGVLGPMAATVAAIEAAEAIKVLTGQWKRVRRQLLHIDLWQNTIRNININQPDNADPCSCCRQRQFDYLNGQRVSGASSLCGRNAVQVRPTNGVQIDFEQMALRLAPFGQITVHPYTLRGVIRDDNREYELTLFRNGRAIIKGTDDPALARGIYARYIGN